MHNIVDRKITEYINKKMVENEPNHYIAAADFVDHVKGLILLYGQECVLNADQSGFEYEIHLSKILRTRGSKKVRACVQSITKMTHSYTLMVTIDANGKLLGPLHCYARDDWQQFRFSNTDTRKYEVMLNEINKASNSEAIAALLAYQSSLKTACRVDEIKPYSEKAFNA
ncbi:hypothetical protein BV898_17988 [Hypsibius exemplaris]|uniref:Uncharacterized protein n=1 Tax=Hypsibius exemplaris TaxID=2072580 RepID=A0A9X6NG09_HYPEX|nr:hypothetical protein BV898_17988 [Hypsibius exemplaris]